MDVVITYVDGQDRLWQEDYAAATGKPVLAKRFRDWGTLKYVMRGIERNMPFVENVFLVVSRESQVPQWVDRSHLRVVLHEDYIPRQFLPTFNCNPIELHFQNIEGLSEEFVYFNDDIFPVSPCSYEDFFCDGRPIKGFSRHLLALNSFKKISKNSNDLALKALGRKPGLSFLRPQHICSALLKSKCREAYDKVSEDMAKVMTTIREDNNYNQYFFLDYLYYQGVVINKRISAKFFSLVSSSPSKIASYIRNTPSVKLICINDAKVAAENVDGIRQSLIEAFESLLPQKSRFEV